MIAIEEAKHNWGIFPYAKSDTFSMVMSKCMYRSACVSHLVRERAPPFPNPWPNEEFSMQPKGTFLPNYMLRDYKGR